MPVFIDLNDCNVGFEHWHPCPVTQKGDRLAGQSDFGGLWEWTSTPFMAHEGFEAMEAYPGYSGKPRVSGTASLDCFPLIMLTFPVADFFDGKHNVILGGSWATHPRIAGRTTL